MYTMFQSLFYQTNIIIINSCLQIEGCCNLVIIIIYFYRFGFIRFDDVESATKALKKFNYSDVDGREIELRYAEERGEGGGGGGFRGGGGGFRGGRGGGGFRGGRGGGRGGNYTNTLYSS